MDLAWNRKAEFTKWVVSAGLLTEPFVLIDVGVQGGENIRWRPLGDCLVVHGFDPIAKVVKDLTEANVGRPNRHYHWMALGNADGQQAFYFNPANPTQARCIALTVIPCHPPVRVFTHPAYKKMLPGQWIA